MKIGLLQLNSTVGDFAANRQKLLAGYEKTVALGAEFVLAPELFLCGYPPRDPEQIAGAILDWLQCESIGPLREHFLSRFTLERHLTNLAEALHSVEPAEPASALLPAAQNP